MFEPLKFDCIYNVALTLLTSMQHHVPARYFLYENEQATKYTKRCSRTDNGIQTRTFNNISVIRNFSEDIIYH